MTCNRHIRRHAIILSGTEFLCGICDTEKIIEKYKPKDTPTGRCPKCRFSLSCYAFNYRKERGCKCPCHEDTPSLSETHTVDPHPDLSYYDGPVFKDTPSKVCDCHAKGNTKHCNVCSPENLKRIRMKNPDYIGYKAFYTGERPTCSMCQTSGDARDTPSEK